jgi:branched-chain amino acid transport system permease protein
MEQTFANAVIAASIYALLGVSFALIYRTCGFFHFSHAASFTLGAYFAFSFIEWFKFPFFFAIISSILLCAIVGFCINKFIFSPLYRKTATPLVLLLASLGLYVVIQNLISLVYGDHIRSIRTDLVAQGHKFFKINITGVQTITLVISVFTMIILSVIMKYTKFGKLLRAVANNLGLARICGIDEIWVTSLAFMIGSAIAGLAGVLVALDIDMSPAMGMLPLMMGIISMILGGTRNIIGIYFGAMFLAIAQNTMAWCFSSQWQDPIAFILLIAFLLIKPQGFLNSKLIRSFG